MTGPATFRAYLQKQDVSPATVKLYLRVARRWERKRQSPATWLTQHVSKDTPRGTVSVLWCAARHWFVWKGHNPEELEGLKPKMRGRRNPPRRALSDEELAAYYKGIEESGIPEPSYTILLLLPRSGLRIAEACALRAEDISDGVLRIVGKGDIHRWVPLSAKAAELLKVKEGHLQTGCLFSANTSGLPVAPGTVRHHLRKLRSELQGYGRKATPHVLRHTWATRALARGVPLAVVQAVLGHASAATTAIYLHPSMDMLKSAVDLVDGDD